MEVENPGRPRCTDGRADLRRPHDDEDDGLETE